MEDILLDVKGLKTSFYTDKGEVEAVRGVDFKLRRKETLGIVGESGSGKSVTSMSVMSLVQKPGRVKAGEVLFKGENLLEKQKREMMHIRGNEVAMIFQDPMTSLNPVIKIGDQLEEVIRRHQKHDRKEARLKAIEMLKLVGIPSPEERMSNYPFEFSGGMNQRVMIAIALSCKPDLLIADEPTTALDVTIQAQILDLMRDLKDKIDASIILITHDLGVINEVCSRVIVMYGGMVMEEGPIDEIFETPKHPYTVGLINSIPKITHGKKEKIIPIPGYPPSLLNPPKGCPFASRCDHRMNICVEETPVYHYVNSDHRTMCWLLDEDAPENPFKSQGAK